MESGQETSINYDASGLVPAIVQDRITGQVLMLGYMNAEALEKTKETGWVTFFSRSKQRLWTKGETSGNKLKFLSVKLDCDKDTLLVSAIPAGATCHTGTKTCWGETTGVAGFMGELEDVIAQRQAQPTSDSYTSSLFADGVNKIAQKVGEEAVELVIEAKDADDERFMDEAADLLFHYLVLLRSRNKGLEDVIQRLHSRHGATE